MERAMADDPARDHKPAITGKLQVFFSYSHKDDALIDELNVALAMLRRNELVESWFDRAIEGGQELDEAIEKHLNSANIILLLVSPAFLASDYCYKTEMKRAIERYEAGEVRVIPIILRPCEWQKTPFARLKALPKDGKPITTWGNRDEALLDVAKELRRVVEELKKSSTLS
jgi:TIR domain